jgi:two-component system response regulator DesR
MRVILADDSALIRERLREMLSVFRQVDIVGSFENGTDTLQALRALKPDLAIVDLKMPGLTGLDVLTGIRKENSTLKFIILTFFSSDYYRQIALQAGVDYFFSKVDDFEKVILVVEEMIDKEEIKSKETLNTKIN